VDFASVVTKAQAILCVLTSIFGANDVKSAVGPPPVDLISGYLEHAEIIHSDILIKRRRRLMSDSASFIIKPSLEEVFLTGWEHCRVFLFSAPLRLRQDHNGVGAA
jgi:hypothetical protein